MPRLQALLNDILNRPDLPLTDVMDAHLTAGYRQRTDGVWSTRDEVTQHLTHLRAIVESAEVTVHEELMDDALYAERHTVFITKRDGGHVQQEVYAFGGLAPDGRFDRIEEITLMVQGEESDRAIGRARG